MRHIDPHKEMIGFVDETLAAADFSACRAHIAACGQCRELYEQVLEANNLIQKLASAHRRLPPDTEIDEAYASCRERLRAGSPFSLNRASRLASLHALLTPLCGIKAAAHLLSVAGGPAEARKAGEFEWNGFVARLAALVRRMCGETAAQLVVEAASL